MKKNLFAVGILCGLALMLAGCKTKIDTQALNTLTSLSQITPADIQVRKMTSSDSVNLNGIALKFQGIAAGLRQVRGKTKPRRETGLGRFRQHPEDHGAPRRRDVLPGRQHRPRRPHAVQQQLPRHRQVAGELSHGTRRQSPHGRQAPAEPKPNPRDARGFFVGGHSSKI